MKQTLFYKKLKNAVQCQLCPHFCTLKEGESGKCGVRENYQGELISLVYNKPCSLALDPIEKKPMNNFLPGEAALSIATVGCNLSCKFCQNYEISQAKPEEISFKELSPEEVVEEARKQDVKIISYTYTEPLIAYEYVLDIARLAKNQGIKNVIVSNGFINPLPLKELCKYIDGANIDLKSIEDDFYKEICGARVSPVLETLKILQKEKVWLEITNLIIPTLNDSEENIKALVLWVKENLGTTTPLHFIGFYPCYQLSNLPPTPVKTLQRARKIASDAGLKYVYTGNLSDEKGSSTFCPKCGAAVIKRCGFSIIENNLKKGRCNKCNEKVHGVWS